MFGLMKPFKRTGTWLPRTETPFGFIPEEFEKLFNRFVESPWFVENREWPYRWALTMEEKEKELLVRFELPGFTPEEVKIELMGERLVVEAEHKAPAKPEKKEEEKAEKVETEREYVHVKREVTLPPEVEPEKAEAEYRNGILEVRIPRKAEMVPRRIAVKT